jgi:urease accessory protein
MATAITMTTDAQQLQLLLAWMSPAFPIGGFAYSHGLEFAIDTRRVTDATSLRQWIEDVLTRGSGWNDAVLFARCWDEDAAALNELALALAGSRERYLETTSLGNAFLQAAEMWKLQEEPPRPLGERGQGVRGQPHDDAGDIANRLHASASVIEPILDFASRAKPMKGRDASRYPSPPAPSPPRGEGSPAERFVQKDTAYPLAAGSFCRAAGIERATALLAHLQSFASTLISVAVRLIPLGQTQGLALLRDLMPIIAQTADRAASATLDDLGSSTIGADIAAMKHETQYSRVFRT